MKRALILLLALFLATPVQAIDLDPGNATALPSGLKIWRVALTYAEAEGLYTDGTKNGDSKIDTSLLLLRYGQTFTLGGYPALWYAEVPIGETKTGNLNLNLPNGPSKPITGDKGVGDLAIMLAVWPYADQEARRYFGLAGYLILPTGQYDNSTLSLGQNRTRFALQAAYQQQLSDKLLWMTAADVLWFGANDDYLPISARLEQKPLYSFQTGLRYSLPHGRSIFGSYYYDEGGTQSLNGVSLDNQRKAHRYAVGADAHFAFGTLGLNYGADLETENGFKQTGRLQLRYLKIF